MAEFHLVKDGKHYKVDAATRDEAINKVLSYVGEEAGPELTGTEQAAAFAGQFAESAFGIGDELGAIGRGIGGSVYDIFNTDKDIMQALRENFNWSEDIAATRSQIQQFEEESPVLSDVAAGAGLATGLAVPIGAVSRTASVGKAALAGAGYGAGFGALSGEGEEGRIEGAMAGALLGGALGAGAQRLGQKLSDMAKDPNVSVTDEAAELADSANWTDLDKNIRWWDQNFVGVSDAIRRRISPEVGGRVQRADETAMRQRNLESAEFVENADMQRVIKLVDDDEKFKGMVLDYAQGAKPADELLTYVGDKLDTTAAGALTKYLNWSNRSNANYNRRLGKNEDAANYLHTQKISGLPGRKPLAPKKSAGNVVDFADDEINLPIDKAQLERTRGLAEAGEVKLNEYGNPFLTNAQRIHNNNRLLQLQEKFGIKNLRGGADGLMDAFETTLKRRGIGEASARDARNAIATMIKGQNKSANAWIKSLQNSGYTVLAGPKTVLLNFHDIPVAAWNNSLSATRGLVNRAVQKSADVQRLGIDGQNVGEFVQDLRTSSSKLTPGERAERITKSITDKAMKYGGFQTADRVAKNQVLKTVAQDSVDRVNAGTLRQRWGTYFQPSELARLEGAIKRTGGDVTKMKPKEQKLYDELLTLGLGQQQLISAAGRPIGWLNNPNLRPLWMMRGFAIKHNTLLAEKIADKLRKGDRAGAAKEATAYLALPGMSYAGMNVGRNELFKEDYEPSGEEFMFSLLDSVLGPITLNSIGVGSSYERSELIKDPATAILSSALPPTGLYGDVAEGIVQAIAREDGDELAKIVTDSPLYKQWAAFFDK